MKNKIFIMLILLLSAFVCGVYSLMPEAQAAPLSTVTASPVASVTDAAQVCKVMTGTERGTVNIRACGGTGCEVLDIVTEGESLDILSAGLWTRVITSRGVTGWINSNYCKGK